MKRGRAEAILSEVKGVVSRWREYAEEAEVTVDHAEQVHRALRI